MVLRRAPIGTELSSQRQLLGDRPRSSSRASLYAPNLCTSEARSHPAESVEYVQRNLCGC